ncbi:MAG: hypothetical protein UW75_C0036G0005 [Parcubacteria group bacterium GW2011_GWF2_44_8]|nr:MAG: hypothetical protein UW75_C0036G0005 [Parcubacteria group bacterium GW2011_GWF2_44_8]
MHKTLLRQMQRVLGADSVLSPKLQDLLQLVSVTYEGFDKERILSERSLEISSKELRLAIAVMKTTLDSVGEGVLVIDENHKIAYHNKQFAEMWEIPTKEITAHLTDQVVDSVISKSADPKLFRQMVDRVCIGEELGNDVTIKLNNKNIIAIRSYPQLLGDKIVGRVWSFRDVTKYLSFQEEIQEKVTELERLNKTMIDREIKMIELKGRVVELEHKLGNT